MRNKLENQLIAETLDLEVRNRSRASQSTATGVGHGLVGMRERAQLAGGSLTTQHEGEVFIVHATLPIGPRGI